MDSKTTREALNLSHLFSGLTTSQFEHICHHSHVNELEEGESLFFQGDEVVCFYLVVSGRMKLFRVSSGGKEKVVEIIEQGHTFAEALMFVDHPHYPVNATALIPSRVIAINCGCFKSMLRNSIDTCFILMGEMSYRIRAQLQEIDTLSLNTGTVRTVAYLLENAPENEKDNDFELNVAKSVIASRLSVKPETFSRILKNLHESNILTINGRKVTIHDRGALTSICTD